jgi:thioredoxin 1
LKLLIKMFSLMVLVLALAWRPATGEQIPEEKDIPVNNVVTMVDLGAKYCVPCKMMAPILTELEKEYHGRAAVIFIDIREQKDKAKEFNVLVIPTQIFYNKSGQEVWRHIGFLAKESIKAKLDALLKE